MIIVSTTNDEYAQHLGVMLTSLLKKTKNRDAINIYIIDGNISADNKRKLNRVVGRYKKEIVFLTPATSLKEALPEDSTIGYITKETYFRIFLPTLLDNTIKKALYLDCDLIVRKDISELWDVNVENHALGAVDESVLFGWDKKERLMEELGMPTDAPYFNAGVLLLNLERWRETDVSNRLVEYLQLHPNLTYMDQDALNAVLLNDWLPLDYKWNYTTYHWDPLPHIKPAIIHFCGWYKPWNSDIRFNKKYFKYLQLSQWNEDDDE